MGSSCSLAAFAVLSGPDKTVRLIPVVPFNKTVF
jgi:hypothetical protein